MPAHEPRHRHRFALYEFLKIHTYHRETVHLMINLASAMRILIETGLCTNGAPHAPRHMGGEVALHFVVPWPHRGWTQLRLSALLCAFRLLRVTACTVTLLTTRCLDVLPSLRSSRSNLTSDSRPSPTATGATTIELLHSSTGLIPSCFWAKGAGQNPPPKAVAPRRRACSSRHLLAWRVPQRYQDSE